MTSIAIDPVDDDVPNSLEYQAWVLLANGAYWDHTSPKETTAWEAARDRWRDRYHTQLTNQADNMLLDDVRQPKILYAHEWLNVEDGNVLVFHRPPWDTYGDGDEAKQLLERIDTHIREAGRSDVLILSLSKGTDLTIMDEETMAKAGWVRAGSPRTPDVEQVVLEQDQSPAP